MSVYINFYIQTAKSVSDLDGPIRKDLARQKIRLTTYLFSIMLAPCPLESFQRHSNRYEPVLIDI